MHPGPKDPVEDLLPHGLGYPSPERGRRSRSFDGEIPCEAEGEHITTPAKEVCVLIPNEPGMKVPDDFEFCSLNRGQG